MWRNLSMATNGRCGQHQRFAAATAAIALLGVVSITSNGAARAGDWPQYRYDAQRSAATPYELPSSLELQWTRQLPPPKPAFPDEVRLAYDHTYEPIVVGKTMFVPSMVTDSLAALDTETGDERWVFFAEGPIRFAPVADGGKVYVASDDGHLYCLQAETGELLWKFRGLPEGREDRKLLGSGRLISLFPARGGPVLDEGIVYFAAGLWPQDGIFVHALDAESGKPVWSNTTSHHIAEANMDHAIAQHAGLTPQGYLARVHQKLVVPCGAQLPAFLDAATGELDTYTMGWGGRNGLPKGTWFVAGAGKYLSHGGDLYDITRPADEQHARETKSYMTEKVRRMMYPGTLTRVRIDPTNQRGLGNFRRPVLTDEAIYYNDVEAGGIAAYDLSNVKLEERSQFEPTKYRAKDLYPDQWFGVMDRLWSLPADEDLQIHIKAGNRLYAATEDAVLAIDIPTDGGEAEVSWSQSIEGTPHSMLAADDKLFVTTREGRLYAFGANSPGRVVVHEQVEPQRRADGEMEKLAADFIEAAGAQQGYALVLGAGRGELVDALLAQSQLYVIAITADTARAGELRSRLYAAGLYGSRAMVLVADPLAHPLPPFLAHLVVSESPDAQGDLTSAEVAAKIFHPLRPYGGTACLFAGSGADQITESLRRANLPGAAVRRHGDFVLLTREGPLPEAAPWSHEGASAANSIASQDRFVKAPLDILWFDSSFRWHRKPGSAEIRVATGRVLVKTDELNAVDAYTGRHLWQADIPQRLADRGAQMVALDDRLYLAGGSKSCLVFDPASGDTIGEIALPEGLAGDWSNLRAWNDYLVATIGGNVVCFDRHTGAAVWQFTCGRDRLAVAVGNGKVYCSELLDRRREASADEAQTRLRAWAIDSGKLLWETVCGDEIHYAEDLDLVVTTADVFQGNDGTRLRDGVQSPQIAGTHLISGTNDRFTLIDLAADFSAGDELQWVRRGCTGLRSSCNLVTTRFRANAAYIDLETLTITPLWNIRPGCNNNLYPAEGLLNVPNVTGGCECNYSPVSKAFAPRSSILRPAG